MRCTQCLNSGVGRSYNGQERVDSRIGVKVCAEEAEWIGNHAGVLACEPRPVVVPPAAVESPQGSAENKVLLNGAWMERDDALFQVVMTGTVHDLRRILAGGANVDAENPHQGRNRALHYASMRKDTEHGAHATRAEICDALLEAGPAMGGRNKEGSTALHLAVLEAHLDVAGVSLYDSTFSRTVWRLYGGAKGLVV